MPVAKKMHHIGIPVSNLGDSVAWYSKVLGVVSAEIEVDAAGDYLEPVLQVPDPALRAAFVKVGDDTMLELIEFERPTSKPFEGRNCDIGVMHLCFEVDDIDQAFAELQEAGVSINCPPIEVPQGDGEDEASPLAGCKFCYFRDPDGIQLELFELP